MAQFANGALGSLVRGIINGISTKVDKLSITGPGPFDIDDIEGVVDAVRDLDSFDPDTKLDVTAVEVVVDERAGVKDATRLGVPINTAVLHRANPENLPPDELEEFDGWAGYAPGTILRRSPADNVGVAITANTDLAAKDMGGVLHCTSTVTVTIRTQANVPIPRSSGHFIAFAIFADGGDVTVAAEGGVTLNGGPVIPDGSWGWVYSLVNDTWGIQ